MGCDGRFAPLLSRAPRVGEQSDETRIVACDIRFFGASFTHTLLSAATPRRARLAFGGCLPLLGLAFRTPRFMREQRGGDALDRFHHVFARLRHTSHLDAAQRR